MQRALNLTTVMLISALTACGPGEGGSVFDGLDSFGPGEDDREPPGQDGPGDDDNDNPDDTTTPDDGVIGTGQSDGLPEPTRTLSHDYVAYLNDMPDHYRANAVAATDNTPNNNPVTNAGATLGRVLFYDTRLSANNSTSCSSCHDQSAGFGDPARLSEGFEGGLTGRHSMSLTNARFYGPGAFFWDERADTLEDQVLGPIQDSVEMGMALDDLEVKLANTAFYPQLFADAFGDERVSSDRISLALAQFVRSLVSYESDYDMGFDAQGRPDHDRVFTQQEQLGMALFMPVNGSGVQSLRCDQCHGTDAQVARRAENNGLDANTNADQGAGQGTFKVPSLRNVAETAPYMHDGRFDSLEQVVDFYSDDIQDHPQLSPILRGGGPNGGAVRFDLSEAERQGLVAFLETLSDADFLDNPMFSDPF